MRPILIVVRMHANWCIASPAIWLYNSRYIHNKDLALPQNKAFDTYSRRTQWCKNYNFQKCIIMSGFCKSNHMCAYFLIHAFTKSTVSSILTSPLSTQWSLWYLLYHGVNLHLDRLALVGVTHVMVYAVLFTVIILCSRHCNICSSIIHPQYISINRMGHS